MRINVKPKVPKTELQNEIKKFFVRDDVSRFLYK